MAEPPPRRTVSAAASKRPVPKGRIAVTAPIVESAANPEAVTEHGEALPVGSIEDPDGQAGAGVGHPPTVDSGRAAPPPEAACDPVLRVGG